MESEPASELGRSAAYPTERACAAIWHREVQLPFGLEGVYSTAPYCIDITLSSRKFGPGGGGGGDTFVGGPGGGGDTFGLGRSASFCWQRLHFFTGLPFLFRLLPCLFTHWHPLLVKPVRVTDLALQRAFFLPGPPTSAGAFLPCFRWTPLHMSVGPTVRPLPRSWQMPLLACPAWLRWQLSSNLHDFLGQPTQMVEVPLGEMGHAAGAAATQAMPATSAARRRSARRAGAPAEARRAMALGRRGGLGPSLGRRRPCLGSGNLLGVWSPSRARRRPPPAGGAGSGFFATAEICELRDP